MLSADERTAIASLPDGGTDAGRGAFIQRNDKGIQFVQDDVTAPEAGKFMFQRQRAASISRKFGRRMCALILRKPSPWAMPRRMEWAAPGAAPRGNSANPEKGGIPGPQPFSRFLVT